MMLKLLKRLILLVLIVLIPLLSICVLRYHLYFSNIQKETLCQDNKHHQPITDRNGLVNRFSQAIQFKTITRGIGEIDPIELTKFIDWIRKTYPTLHNSKLVKLEKVANYSLLYTIKGTDSSLKPYLLCSHLDVVPVDESKWENIDPFKGIIKDGYIYGRGTMDVKDAAIGILESLEHLLKNEKFVPKRTILVAFGHDEEGSGVYGAGEMSKILQSRYKELEFIFDEGSFIMKKSFPGIVGLNTAFISVAEKGYLTVELNIKDTSLAGHSSMPPPESTITKLAKAVSKFKSTTFPSHFGSGPEVGLLEQLAPYAKFPFNYIYSNLWLFSFFINQVISAHPMGNSLIRTTTALTMFNSGIKDNVLPQEAMALINHRIHPLDSIESALEYDRQIINDDSIELSIYKNVSFESHPISPYDEDSFGFNVIKKSIQQLFDNTLVVPGVMVASTDTKHYLPLSKNIYRFTPILADDKDIKRFHGNLERVEIENYIKLVNFYHHVIISADQPNILKKKLIKDEL